MLKDAISLMKSFLKLQKINFLNTLFYRNRAIWRISLLYILTLLQSNAQNYNGLFNSSNFTKSIDLGRPIGATAGEAGVSPTGAGTYTIPIAVPPGTNGVTPSVALVYNSMGGNGIVGMGWSISGLSMISRVPRTIYQDGVAGSVELNGDDRFALDGVRLVAKSGSYGADGTVYATESETFARITSYNQGGVSGTGWFKVESKDGTVMEYGNSSDARRQDYSNAPAVFWLLKRIKYPDGNYIEFNYTEGENTRIDQINYTGNSNTGQDPYNKIKFDYFSATRSDNTVVYENGVAIRTNNLLERITVTTENQSQTVRTYELNYGFDNINSYLREITEKGSDGSALNSTIFKYGDIPQGFTLSSPSFALGSAINVSSGDFDGDGYTDILEIPLAYTASNIEYNSGFKIHKRTAQSESYTKTLDVNLPNAIQVIQRTNVPNFYNFLSGDFTGDGIDDIVTSNITISGSNRVMNFWRIYKIENNATTYSQIDIPTYPNYTQVPSGGNYMFPGDFNGDGVQDILSILGSGNTYAAQMYLGNISTTFGAVQIDGSHSLTMHNWASADKVYVLDFNGDGKSDLMVIKDNQCEIFSFGGATEYNGKRIYSSNYPTKNHLIYLGDFNGDRKTDLLTRPSQINNNENWTKSLSTGTYFTFDPFNFQKKPSITNSYTDDQMIIADFNQDGKTDVYVGWNFYGDGVNFSYANLDLYYSRGNDFYYTQHQSPLSLNLSMGKWFNGDLNGDGRTDLINRVNNASFVDVMRFRSEGKEHLLEKVANGHGHVTEWNYKRLNEAGSFYAKNGNGDATFTNIQIPLYAVSEFKSQNGIGGVSTMQYAYEEAKIHKKGKGLLGFRKFTSFNLTMDTKAVVEMQFNTYPLATAVSKTSASRLNNTLLNETTYNNEFIAYGSQFGDNKRYWQRVSGTNENNAFEGRNVSTSYSYDNDGNVTQSTVNNNGVETITTNSSYGAFATPVPARPTSVTVTKTRSGQSAYSVTTNFGYNGLGQLTSKTEFAGLPQSVQTAYSYNNLGNVTQTTVSPSGMTSRSTSSNYDSRGRYATSTTNVLGQTSNANYDPKWGKPTSVQGIDGLTTTYEYDAFGRTKKTRVPENYDIYQNYEWNQNNGAIYSITIQHPGKPDVETWYDVLGREVRTETEGFQGQSIIQTKSYNARGNVVSQVLPYKSGEPTQTVSTVYDDYNRPISISNSAFGATSIGYSYWGGELTVTTTNPANQTSSKVTDAAGQTILATDNGGTLNYTYNSQGNLTQVQKDGNTLTSSQYNDYGRQTQLTDQNAGTTTYAYDALGQLTSQTNPNNQTTTMQYDVAGRITTRNGPEGTTSYEYFDNGSGAATGQLKKVNSFAGNVEEYTYDNMGRVSSVKESIDGTDHTTSYGYNQFGAVTTKNFPSGFVLVQEYDGNGYPTVIKSGSNQTIYTNNGLSGLGVNTQYSLGNGKSSTVSHYFGMPTQYSTAGVQDLVLSWNYQSGNLNQRKDNVKGREENFGYDNLNRLTSAQVVGYSAVTVSYNSDGNQLGNITSKTDVGNYSYTSGRPNAVTGVTNTNSVIPNAGQNINYTPFSQPATVTENGYELTYTYGADYNRIRSITKQNGNEINRRYYFGEYEVETNINGIKIRELHYISSPAGLVAIVVRENGNDSYFYTYTDHLGSILTVTNNSGTVVAEQNFDAWGRRRNPTTWVALAPTAATGLPVWLYRGYTGHEQLDNFGLINMNGRLYDPALGRMLSVDNYVVGSSETQAFNRYTYAFNNPLVYNDPDGNCPICIGFMVGIFAGSIQNMIQGNVPDNMWEFLKPGVIGAATAALGPVFGVAGKYAAGILASGATPVVQGIVANAVSTALSSAFSMGISGGNIGMGFLQGLVTGSATSLVGLNKTNPTGSPSQVASVVDEFDPKSITGIWLDPVIVKATKETTPLIWSHLVSKRDWYNYFHKADHIADAAQWMVLDVFGGSMINAMTLPVGVTSKIGGNLVYQGVDAAGVVRYVGITERSATVRFAEHLNSIGSGKELLNYRVIEGATNLSRTQARIWEQTLINQYGLQKNGGLLINKINSIAPKNWLKYGIKP
jgi:RHS repeat-associated protein